MDIEKFLNICTNRFSVIDGVESFKRNQWFRHLLLPHPPRAEYQKCQEREVLHRLTRRKVLETGTELETESFVLGLIHRFHLSTSQVPLLLLVSEISRKPPAQLLLVCARVPTGRLVCSPTPGAVLARPSHHPS